MNQKLLDYEKILKVIRSCVTNAQNQTAYSMCWNFHDMYKVDTFSLRLFRVCDENLIDLVGRKQ